MVISRYGTADHFAKTFAPSKQFVYCRPQLQERLYMGDAPRLIDVAGAYSEGDAMAWLNDQLFDFSEYCGAKEKTTAAQRLQGAALILGKYPHLKVTEVMAFFVELKAGLYGRCYGVVDMQQIMEALWQFNLNRARLRNHYEEEMERLRHRAEAEAHQAAAISLDEWRRRHGITETKNENSK